MSSTRASRPGRPNGADRRQFLVKTTVLATALAASGGGLAVAGEPDAAARCAVTNHALERLRLTGALY